tara:strand:- start:71605 stop:73113 length:1509 start_codon:yes stop_codon:yes gene_type:complete
MNLQSMLGVALGLGLGVSVVGLGCSKEDPGAKAETAVEGAETAGAKGKETAAEGKEAGTSAVVEGRKSEKPAAKDLLETAVERRLYSDRIEASSFAWGNYNRFHENYHPNYLMDGDPVTTWLEDVPGNGIGEWVRIATSPIEGTTKLRLRMQNGYHKSESLFKKNSRVKAMEIKVLPDGPTKRFELADSMEWQELEMGFGSTKFEGIELKMLEAYGGTKYDDLCISDLELFVTGRTPENPAFEAKKLAQVQEWKESRIDAAKMFEDAASSELPIKSAYKVVKSDTKTKFSRGDDYNVGAQMLAMLAKEPNVDAKIVARANAALASKFAGWKHYRPVIKNPMKVPDVDGLVSFRTDRSAYGWRDDVFELPALKKGKSLANNQRVALFEAKNKKMESGLECTKGREHAQRPAEAVGPNASELLVWRCFEEEEREGVYRYMSWELLEYDEDGWLQLAIGPQSAHVFHWDKSDTGVTLASASRVSHWGRNMAHLTSSEASGVPLKK